jgi:hypothetical protein
MTRRTDDKKTTAVRHLSPAQQAVTEQVSSWPGITVHDHRFGGVEFRAGRRELGHLHPAFADLPFARSVRDALVSAKRARPHHILPDSGWVTVPMRNQPEIDNVIELFRMNYERSRPSTDEHDVS